MERLPTMVKDAMMAATKKECVRASLYARVTLGSTALSTVLWIDVAPTLKTTEGSMLGAYLAKPWTSLLVNTFCPMDTKSAPPRLGESSDRYSETRDKHDLRLSKYDNGCSNWDFRDAKNSLNGHQRLLRSKANSYTNQALISNPVFCQQVSKLNKELKRGAQTMIGLWCER